MPEQAEETVTESQKGRNGPVRQADWMLNQHRYLTSSVLENDADDVRVETSDVAGKLYTIPGLKTWHTESAL